MTEDTTLAAAPPHGAAPAAEPFAVTAPGAPALSPASPTAASSEESDWRAALPGDLRRSAEKFASPADAVRSYAELERRLGRSVTVPGPNADVAEIDAFHARLGRPATPEGYRISVPDGVPAHLRPGVADSEFRNDFLRSMHAAGATPAVVQAATAWYYRNVTAADRAGHAAVAEGRAEAAANMRREWGADYDRKCEHSRRAAHHFGGEALARLMAENGLGNHPAWLRTFARIGAELAEDGILTGAAPDGAKSAEERIDAIMDKHYGKPSYGTPAVQGELRELYENIYGTGPARTDAA